VQRQEKTQEANRILTVMGKRYQNGAEKGIGKRELLVETGETNIIKHAVTSAGRSREKKGRCGEGVRRKAPREGKITTGRHIQQRGGDYSFKPRKCSRADSRVEAVRRDACRLQGGRTFGLLYKRGKLTKKKGRPKQGSITIDGGGGKIVQCHSL